MGVKPPTSDIFLPSSITGFVCKGREDDQHLPLLDYHLTHSRPVPDRLEKCRRMQLIDIPGGLLPIYDREPGGSAALIMGDRMSTSEGPQENRRMFADTGGCTVIYSNSTPGGVHCLLIPNF